MKLVFKSIFAILALSIIIIGCTNNDDNQNNNNMQNEIESNVKIDSWRITKFIDSDDDETNHFTGYNFTFGNNNVLTATNGVNTYTGIWSISDSSSNDDSQDDLDFNIFFASPDDFEELSEDWDFISQSSTKIELIHISGGGGGTDYLTFMKN